jgi:salicylate hydroxylase
MANDSTSSRGLRVAIVGGGLGGLCAAAFLHRTGAQVTVFEQAPKLSEVGAGINMGPNAGRVLHHLGLTEAMNKAGEVVETAWEFRRWNDASVLFSQPRGEHTLRLYGAHGYFIHRTDLLNILISAIPNEIIELGRKFTGLEQDESGVRLSFADGSTAEADVVIGADGVHSVVRQAVDDTPATTFSGQIAWRCLIPAQQASEFALQPVQRIWIGPERHVTHYPIRNRMWVNAVAITPAREWTPESGATAADASDVVAEFEGWNSKLTDLLAACTTSRWALLEREPLARWAAGRIALLGDSAHPMFPFLGQGAGQAFEDAACLSECLAGVHPADAAQALQRYQSLRMARATEVQRRSHEASEDEHLPDGAEQQLRDERFALRDPLGHYSWLYEHDAVAHAAQNQAR